MCCSLSLKYKCYELSCSKTLTSGLLELRPSGSPLCLLPAESQSWQLPWPWRSWAGHNWEMENGLQQHALQPGLLDSTAALQMACLSWGWESVPMNPWWVLSHFTLPQTCESRRPHPCLRKGPLRLQQPVSLSPKYHTDLYSTKLLVTPRHCRVTGALFRLTGCGPLGAAVTQVSSTRPQMARESGGGPGGGTVEQDSALSSPICTCSGKIGQA